MSPFITLRLRGISGPRVRPSHVLAVRVHDTSALKGRIVLSLSSGEQLHCFESTFVDSEDVDEIVKQLTEPEPPDRL